MPQDQYIPSNYRIISLRQAKKILHIEDALDIDRVRFDAYAYEKGNGASSNAHAYVDVHEARILFFMLRHARVKQPFQAIGGSHRDGEPQARVITVEEAEGTKNPIRITLENGPATHDDQGLFKPAWWKKDSGIEPDDRVVMLISRTDAVRLALAGLEHLQAWATATYWQRLADTWSPDLADQPPVDPTTGEILTSGA